MPKKVGDMSFGEFIKWIQLKGGSGANVTVTELDGAPEGTAVTKIIFPNGTVTLSDSDATATIDISSLGGGSMSQFYLEDGDGTEVTINNNKEVKFVEGGFIDINWTDTSHGSDSDPYDLTFTVSPPVTAINNATESELVTIGSTTTELDGEANLTYNGTTFTVNDDMTVGSDGTGHDVRFYSATSGDYMLWDTDNEKLIIEGTHGATSLDVTDGNVAIGDGTLTVGSDGAGEDVTFHSDTSGDYLKWDSSEEQLIIEGTHDTTALDITDGNVVVGDGSLQVINNYNSTTFENQLSDGEAGTGDILKYEPGGSTTLTLGQLYYLCTGGTWCSTDADSVNTGAKQLLGIALGTSATSNGMLLRGFVKIPSTEVLNLPGSGASDGLPLYISTTAGHLDFTAPSGTGDFVRLIGWCVDDDSSDILLWFNPDPTWVEIT